TTGNKGSVLHLDGNVVTFKQAPESYLGTLLHEIGHHVVNTARVKPWATLRKGKASTHLTREWVWICQKGWSHFWDDVPSMDSLLNVVNSRNHPQRQEVVVALRSFNPYHRPPELESFDPRCGHCH